MKNNVLKFKTDILRGEVGEKLVSEYLESLNDTIEIIDTTKIKEYQDVDIDFIVRNKFITYSVEVKYDSVMHISNNFPYEYYSDKRIKSIGCMEKTKANIIFFLSDNTYDCYIIDTNSLKAFVSNQLKLQNNQKNIGKKILEWKEMGDNAIGFLIPLYRFDDYGIRYKKINLKHFL